MKELAGHDLVTEAIETINAHQDAQFSSLMTQGIRKRQLDEFERFMIADGTLLRPSLIIRCQIHGDKIAYRTIVDKLISRPRLFSGFLPFLDRVAKNQHSHADFFVLLSDNIYIAPDRRSSFVEYLSSIPLLRSDYRESDDISLRCIKIPDFSIQEDAYSQELKKIQASVAKTPFHARLGIIKWRGSLSGPQYPDIDNCHLFPRYLLLLLSLRYPEVVDARLTTYFNLTQSIAAERLRVQLEQSFGPASEFLPPESFLRYKYLISLDGAVSAWRRVPTILASRSVLLLQHRWKQFFYPGLKPWIHYVPVADDLSTLLETFYLLESHPEKAEEIAENGRSFASKILNPQALVVYFARSLKLLSSCHRD